MVKQRDQFRIQMHHGDRGPCHLHRGAIRPHQSLVHRQSRRSQPPGDAGIKNIQLHQGRGPQRVDQHCHLVARRGLHFDQDRIHDLIRHLISRAQRATAHSRFAVDAHADFHLTGGQVEIDTAGLRKRACGQRHAHGIRARVGMAGKALHLIQRLVHVGGSACGLEDEDVACHATPFAALGRGRDVVSGQDGAGLDPLDLQQLGGHVEVHHVARIVAVHEQHPSAAIGRQRRIDNGLRRRRGKHVADGRSIGQTLAHKANKGRLVPGPSANDQGHLAGTRAMPGH